MDELNNSINAPADDMLDLNEVMSAFGVTTWENLGLLDTTYGTGFHLLVEIAGERYVLQERPETPQGDDFSQRYDFQRYLQQAGIPVPAYRLTAQGEPAVALGEDIFELQQWPSGELFSSSDPRNLDRIGDAASLLGRLHQASQRYTGPALHWPSEAHIGGIVQSYLNLAQQKADETAIPAISSALLDWLAQWEGVLPAAMMSIGSARNLPEFHIHGDYHAHNLRFAASGVSAVIGLEAARREKRLFEIAYALFSFSALRWEAGSNLTSPLVKRGLDPERAQHFLRHYATQFPPVHGEAVLLADALSLIAPIATLNGPLEDVFYPQGDTDTPPIDDVMDRLAWATTFPSWLARVRGSLADMWQ